MLLGAECRWLAAQCVVDARKSSRHRSDLFRLARAWVKLARQMDRMDAQEGSCSSEWPRATSVLSGAAQDF
jgi:hypothetical protein